MCYFRKFLANNNRPNILILLFMPKFGKELDVNVDGILHNHIMVLFSSSFEVLEPVSAVP